MKTTTKIAIFWIALGFIAAGIRIYMEEKAKEITKSCPTELCIQVKAIAIKDNEPIAYYKGAQWYYAINYINGEDLPECGPTPPCPEGRICKVDKYCNVCEFITNTAKPRPPIILKEGNRLGSPAVDRHK